MRCVRRVRMEASVLAAPGAALKAKLSEKLRFLPSANIRGMMPAGANVLAGVPARLDFESKAQWVAALRQTVACFSKAQKSNDTLKEEESYVVWVNTWLELSSHGTFVIVDRTVRSFACCLLHTFSSAHDAHGACVIRGVRTCFGSALARAKS